MSDGDTTNSTSRSQSKLDDFKNHVLAHKADSALWMIRILAILFSVGYFLPLFWSSQTAYYKAIVANAAVNALRLHQRIGRVQLNRAFFHELLKEDSFHYLFYSIIFLYVGPVTLVLLPIVLFCLLHAASYSLTLLDIIGQNSWWGARLLISLVEFQSMNILRLISFTEIVLMPFTVVLTLTGRASILTPFIYYHFLGQRYLSRRNPYTKNMFRELRILLERTAAKPSMPQIVKTVLLGIVKFTSSLAPPPPPQQTPQQQQ